MCFNKNKKIKKKKNFFSKMSVYQRGELKYLGNGTLYSLGKALSKFYLIPNEKSHGFNREILLEYAKENSKYHRVPAIACS